MSTSVVSVAVVTCTSRCGGSSVIAKLNVPCAQAWLAIARVKAAATDAVLSQAVGPSRALPSNTVIDASAFLSACRGLERDRLWTVFASVARL